MKGEADATHQAHAQYYLALVEEAETGLRMTCQVSWLKRLDQEYDNVRVALHWLMEREDGEKALRFCAAIWRFWILRGYLSEGRQWLERVLKTKIRGTSALRS